MKCSSLFAATAVLFVCASLPLNGQDNTIPPPQQRRPLPKPTNLQVLPKDISSQDLLKVMRGYSQALGVHCNFCHEANEQTHQANFASDAKHDKGIARTMIAMTQEINTKFMTQISDPDATSADKTVTCGTCHRGNTMPAQFIPQPGEHHDEHPAENMPMQHPE